MKILIGMFVYVNILNLLFTFFPIVGMMFLFVSLAYMYNDAFN